MKEERLLSTPEALRQRFQREKRMRIVLEVGTHSPWISRLLEGLGHEVVVANARRVRLIADAQDKDDPVDAETLARLGRSDPRLLRGIQHRSVSAQIDLATLRSRDALVRSRSLLIAHVRGLVKSIGARLPACSAEAFANKASPALPEALRSACAPVLEIIAQVSAAIRGADRQIETLCRSKYPVADRFAQQVDGIGHLTALAYVLTLENPQRFARSRSVGPYLGLCRKRRKSGDADPQLGITKAGDPYLRRLLVQCAQYLIGPLGPDCDLRRWGLHLAAGGRSAKKRAVIAVARKLAVLLHHLWVSGRDYDSFHESVRTAPLQYQSA